MDMLCIVMLGIQTYIYNKGCNTDSESVSIENSLFKRIILHKALEVIALDYCMKFLKLQLTNVLAMNQVQL